MAWFSHMKMCQLCMCRTANFVNIFEHDLADIISDFLHVQVSTLDAFPPYACKHCGAKLQDFKVFKDRCVLSRSNYLKELAVEALGKSCDRKKAKDKPKSQNEGPGLQSSEGDIEILYSRVTAKQRADEVRKHVKGVRGLNAKKPSIGPVASNAADKVPVSLPKKVPAASSVDPSNDEIISVDDDDVVFVPAQEEHADIPSSNRDPSRNESNLISFGNKSVLPSQPPKQRADILTPNTNPLKDKSHLVSYGNTSILPSQPPRTSAAVEMDPLCNEVSSNLVDDEIAIYPPSKEEGMETCSSSVDPLRVDGELIPFENASHLASDAQEPVDVMGRIIDVVLERKETVEIEYTKEELIPQIIQEMMEGKVPLMESCSPLPNVVRDVKLKIAQMTPKMEKLLVPLKLIETSTGKEVLSKEMTSEKDVISDRIDPEDFKANLKVKVLKDVEGTEKSVTGGEKGSGGRKKDASKLTAEDLGLNSSGNDCDTSDEWHGSGADSSDSDASENGDSRQPKRRETRSGAKQTEKIAYADCVISSDDWSTSDDGASSDDSYSPWKRKRKRNSGRKRNATKNQSAKKQKVPISRDDEVHMTMLASKIMSLSVERLKGFLALEFKDPFSDNNVFSEKQKKYSDVTLVLERIVKLPMVYLLRFIQDTDTFQKIHRKQGKNSNYFYFVVKEILRLPFLKNVQNHRKLQELIDDNSYLDGSGNSPTSSAVVPDENSAVSDDTVATIPSQEVGDSDSSTLDRRKSYQSPSSTIDQNENLTTANENQGALNTVSPLCCQECGKVFTSKLLLEKHLEAVHRGTKNLTCRFCKKVFSHLSYLEAHLLTHTRRNPSLEKKIKSKFVEKKSRYTCLECNKHYSRNDHLKRHHRIVHLGLKKHVCKVCNEAFSEPASLKIHMKVHLGETPFICNLCGANFTHCTRLCLHMEIHEECRKLSCPICDMKFVTDLMLKRHLRKVHRI